jgi:muconolactone D-isomerase
MENNQILVNFTIETIQLPSNFQEIIKHEQALIGKWKVDGLVEHLFLKPTKNGALIIFTGLEEDKVKELMQSLPLYQFLKSVEYLPLIKQF